MKNVLVHASKGYVVVSTSKKARFNRTLFKLGEEVSTIPNGLYAIADVLEKLAQDPEDQEVYRIYTIPILADKLNNTSILVREYLQGAVLGNKRTLLELEVETYKRIIDSMRVLYGRVYFVAETYIPKVNFKDEEEACLPTMMKTAQEMIKARMMPAPSLEIVESQEEEQALA